MYSLIIGDADIVLIVVNFFDSLGSFGCLALTRNILSLETRSQSLKSQTACCSISNKNFLLSYFNTYKQRSITVTVATFICTTALIN